MKHRLLLMALLLALVPGLLLPAQAQEDALAQLLIKVPAPANREQYYLSYVDYEALLAAHPDTRMPAPGQDMNSILETPEGSALTNALATVSAGVSEVMLMFRQQEQVEESMGISLFSLKKSLSAGLPPAQQAWLVGEFDESKVRAALMNKGYEAVQGEDPDLLRFCAEGDCSKGAEINLEQRDPAFLFGGTLGARWPVALSEDTLAATPDATLFSRLFAQDGNAYGEDELVKSMLSALQKDGVSPSQFLLVSGFLAFLKPVAGDSLVAIAQVDQDQGQSVRLAISYADLQAAKAAQEKATDRVENARLSDQSTLKERLDRFSGSLQQAEVVNGPQGSGVLVYTFQFQKPEDAKPGTMPQGPFSLFYRVLMQRDLDWLQN